MDELDNITENKVIIENEIGKKKGGKIFRWVRNIFILIILFIFITTVSLYFLAQTHTFRKFVLDFATDIINNELIAKVEIGDLRFSLTKGIRLSNVKLITAGDTLANIPELSLQIDYEALFNSKVLVRNVILTNPHIKLLRNSVDSVWNYDLIAKPTESDSTKSNTIFDISKLVMIDANFIMYDSTIKHTPSKLIDYDHLNLKKLNMNISALIKPSINDFNLKINDMSFIETFSKFKVNKFQGNINLNEKIISVSDLVINTDDIELDANLKMTNFNVFGEENEQIIDNAMFDIEIDSDLESTKFIDYFTDLSFRIENIQYLKLNGVGTLNKMDINELVINSGSTELFVNGAVLNMLKPEDFAYSLTLDNSFFDKSDILKVLPDMELQKILPVFRNMKFENMFVYGTVDTVYSKFYSLSDLGSLKGVAGVGFKNDVNYTANIRTQNFDLAKVLKNTDYSSRINAEIVANGSGTDLLKMNSNIVLKVEKSNFNQYSISSAYLKANLTKGGLLQIDSLYALQELFNNKNEIDIYKSSVFDEEYSTIISKGFINFADLEHPIYDINVELSAVNIARFTHNTGLPRHLSGSISIEGSGFHPDSIQANMVSSFDEILFEDRALFPFEISANFSRIDSINRKVELHSDFVNANLEGKFIFSELISTVTNQGLFISNFIADKINALNPNRNLNDSSFSNKMGDFPFIDGTFRGEIIDFSPVNSLLDSLDLYGKIYFDVLIQTDSSKSLFIIDSLKIDEFNLTQNDLVLKIKNLGFSGNMIMTMVDSLAKFDHFDLKMFKTGSIVFNDVKIDEPQLNLDFDGQLLKMYSKVLLNDNINIFVNGIAEIKSPNIHINLDTVQIKINEKYEWKNKETISFLSTPRGLELKNVSFFRDKFEYFTLTGNFIDNKAENIILKLFDFQIEEAKAFFPETYKKMFETLKGNLGELTINANGELDSPQIKLNARIDSMFFNEYYLDKMFFDLDYSNKNIFGKAKISKNNTDLITIDINKLPIYLGMKDSTDFFVKGEQTDIKVNTEYINAQIAGPFIPNVSNVRGQAKLMLEIFGELPDNGDYKGYVDIKTASFRLDNTNIHYLASGYLSFETGKVNIKELNLLNVKDDNRGSQGKATITGNVELQKSDISYMDLNIKADRLLVLSDASFSAMPDLYGDFVISSEGQHLHFYGTFKEPNLDGDVNVMVGEIKMPLEDYKQKYQTRFKYEFFDDKVRITTEKIEDSTVVPEVILTSRLDEIPAETSIADLMNYNLNIKILGSLAVTMDMGSLGTMYVVIGTRVRNEGFRYIKKRDNPQANIFGELVLKEQSSLKSFKMFNTSGTISFPTGSIDNPTLDIIATYNGILTENNTTKRYEVKMFIKGPKKDPQVRFSYAIDGTEATGDQERINEDAIYLLISGKLKGGQSNISSDLVSESGLSFASGLTSQALTKVLMKFGFIQNADINFKGNAIDEATFKLSGQVAGGVTWTIGGKLSDFNFANNDLTVDVPMSVFFENPFWNNFILQGTRAMNVNTTTTNRNAKLWEVKLKVGGSF